MLYALSFLFIFAIGGLTGLPLAVLSTDVQLQTRTSWWPTSTT